MHDPRARIDLLLVNADDRLPMLEGGLDSKAASDAPAPDPRPKPEELWGDEDAPDDLSRQRWGVIAPAGDDGDRLIDAIAPLLELRRRQQGRVRVYRVPARMTMDEAVRWKKRVFRSGADVDNDLPRYQLIVGDLDQVPLAVQQAQATDGFVGRIAFDGLDGYRAYADKVVRWEDRPAPATEGHAILHAVRDGTPATRRGYEALIAPGEDILRRRRAAGEVRYGALRVTGSERPAPDELWAAAVADRPSVLMSLSHGVGVPRAAGRGGVERQRREQGALSFVRGEMMTGADVAGRGFLPGGIWLAVACFSAGTTEVSDYRHWLDTLRRTGHVGSEIGHVLATLAHDRPFVAALPKAALADPGGPLAFVGHVDLAWTYSFFDLDDRPRRRPGRLMGVLQALLNRHRAGVAVQRLMRFFAEVNTELTALQDAWARSHATRCGESIASHDFAGARSHATHCGESIESHGFAGARSHATHCGESIASHGFAGARSNATHCGESIASHGFAGARSNATHCEELIAHERARRGHLWMLRQDLAGYVLLGDPAVRLPITDGSRDGSRESRRDNRGSASGAHVSRVSRAEAAVLAVLRGDPVADTAARYDLDRAELERLVASYRAAGHAALEAACRRDRGP